MKRILSIIEIVFIILIMCGCSIKDSNNDVASGTKEIPFQSLESYENLFEDVEFPLTLEELDIWDEIGSIETREYAIEVGDRLIEEYKKSGKYSDFVLCSYVYYSKENAWRFDYSIDQSTSDADELIDCSVMYIVIDGGDGRLIAAWVEE